MSVVIGLTGGIGSGKTTVANKFATLGVPLVDADIIARDVVAIGSVGLAAIIDHFGTDIVLTDGSLNRAKLRELIFAEPSDKAWLDNLLHPLIRKEMQRQIDNIDAPYCLLVVPLLVENGLTSMTQRVLVVDVSVETQIARTTARDKVSEQQVQRIVSLQASREQRLAAADDIIDNNHGEHALDAQVTALHRHYLALAEDKA